MVQGPYPPHSTPPSLVDHNDSILAIIDLQPGFLAKISGGHAATLVDNARFLASVAGRLSVPTFVTVEEPSVHGSTDARVRAALSEQSVDQDKKVFGLCGQDNLKAAILAQPRRTAVLVGLETDVCVLQSAVGLREVGFRALIVRDAVGAPVGEHEHGLERARALGIELIHTKGLYYEWARTLDMLAQLKGDTAIVAPSNTRL
jgi:nicotinamidase-related amidase